MALPAGRYGVTKNQLLKIKKLPMNTIKLIEELAEKFDLLGSAAFKNSTSVVTQSTDLVESGAVYDVIDDTVGWISSNILVNTGTSQEGITVNADGSITVNGTFNTTKVLDIARLYNMRWIGIGTFKLSGCASGGSGSTYKIDLQEKVGDSWIVKAVDYGDGAEFKVSNSELSNECNARLVIYAGTYNNITFDPKIRHISVDEQKCDNSVIGTVEGANASKAWSVGEHFISGGQFKEVTQPISSGGEINSSNTVDKPIADCFKNVTSVLTISSNADLSNIKRGLNAVKFASGITIGTASGQTPVTLANNYRGYIMRDDNVIQGIIANFDSSSVYFISSSSLSSILYCRELV